MRKKNGKFDVYTIPEKSSDGYVLEVYLEYPDKLHEWDNNYPLAQDKL